MTVSSLLDCTLHQYIQKDYSPGENHLLLQLSNGKVRHLHYPLDSPSDLPPLGNPDILEGENDLTALSFLHEPAVLHNLRVRFLDYSSIYTYCGIVLVAINPYDQLPIYGEEVIDAYSGQDMADMEPHIFSVAEEAYRTMTRQEKNQSIIISGESGSGKTVSAKFTMRYFAVVGGAAQQTSVEERVLSSNPIMESIGNAKTIRNDNSSRFGKYIEIGFGRKGDIIGANMRTYLLEKSRVVFQASAERNYHIFYQLCASRELPEMRSLKLGKTPSQNFRYTNQGGEMQIPGTDDLENGSFFFQMELFRILSAILHLGNAFVFSQADDHSLAVFSKLLGVEGPQMAHWLCHRRLAVGGEMLAKPMSGRQAVEARDALAKHIYGQLFTWTVQRLNSALRAQRGHVKSFIGVLDIYGFETFDQNSFEQFCINYANEKLQQQFNRHVFHLEQEEYVREELAWSRIEFSDNQQCINLIEGQLGLFDLLDEECRMPKGSDESWVQKLYDQHLTSKPHPHFQKPRMSNSAFIVLHFADVVKYECDGFLDKNRDTVFEELVNILKASQLVAELFQQQENAPSLANGGVRPGKRATREHKLTVGFQFRQSLQMLMDTLNSTTPHYVRCIKPNDFKEPFVFDPKRTVQQLRACGVLETIRISAAGYPSRWTYEEFFSRYRILLRGLRSPEQVQSLCKQNLPQLIPDPDQYCFGKTKVFFRAGQVALLERLRAERLHVAALIIQSRVRGWLARIRYARILWAMVTIQRYCRGALARRLALTLRYTKAALVIQKTYRMVVVRQLFLVIRQATITIQAFTRGTLARQRHRLRAAVLLQARVRGWLAREAYRRVRAAVVLMQCCVRRRAAKRELMKLKTEARSVERYRELNKGMEVKLMQLQLRADQQVGEGETLHAEREAAIAEVEALKATIQKLESQKHEKHQQWPVISEKEVEERRRAEEKAAQTISQLTQVLFSSLYLTLLLLSSSSVCVFVHMCAEWQHQAVSEASAALRAELDEERRKYQGLLREFARLEQRYDNLRDMSLLTERAKGHRRTDSTQSLSFEPPSPTLLSPQSLGPLSPSPFQPSLPSPEEVRRISVTSFSSERRLSVWSIDSPMVRGRPCNVSPHLFFPELRNTVSLRRLLTQGEIQLRSQFAPESADVKMWSRRDGQTGLPLICPLVRSIFFYISVVLNQHCCSRAVTCCFFLCSVPPSPLTAETSSCPTQQKPATVTGLLECRKRDETKLIKNLITDIRVDSAVSLPPGLPASVIFLCVRQADCSGDQTRARSLCSAAVTAMKAALKVTSGFEPARSLWLKNVYLLHDLLTQHSPKSTLGSDELVPLTADISDLIRALSDLCIQAYQQLLSITETHLQNIIVPALLEAETIPGLCGSAVKLGTSRKRAGSDPRTVGGDAPTMASVLRELGALHTALSHQALPPTLIEQAFHQLTYLISASALNSLLLRKDMCSWSRGMQIRYNVSILEEWLRSRSLQAGGAVATLEPLIQAVQLLQAGKKTEADARALVQTCTALSSQQIVKILTLYTPHSDLDERVTLNFIRSVQVLPALARFDVLISVKENVSCMWSMCSFLGAAETTLRRPSSTDPYGCEESVSCHIPLFASHCRPC
uniref:Methyl-CpG binding domain protein 3b n=1 Tax=Anabas testudineus TaxID=64144 RepID=A0A7N6BN81_ANATE